MPASNLTCPRTAILAAAALCGALLCTVSSPANADVVAISYSPPGEQSANFAELCSNTTHCFYGTEDFSTWTGGNFTSSFTTGANSIPTGVTFTGVYQATDNTTGSQWLSEQQNEYGGTDGANYPELYGPGAKTGPAGQTQTSYTLDLSATGLPAGKSINYFGVWISALDPYNDLKIYNTQDQLIAEFDSSSLLAALGTCDTSNPYCGNPTSNFLGQDPNELFVFVNVYDLTGGIGSVQFFNSGGTGFESTNDTVAYIDPIHVFGTTLSTTTAPEPASLTILGAAIGALAGLRGKRRREARSA